jgi:Mn2+/Fe2+ NRAMP family transporter
MVETRSSDYVAQMSDTWFVPVFAIVLLFFAAVGVVLTVWPSMFLRHVRNPLQPDTPINRVHARALGVFVCLFVLVTISGAFEGFHRNILVALSVSPIVLPIFLWILWRYSSLQRVNRRYLTGEAEESHWELRMSIAFCSLLSIMVVFALLLAMSGIYPK